MQREPARMELPMQDAGLSVHWAATYLGVERGVVRECTAKCMCLSVEMLTSRRPCTRRSTGGRSIGSLTTAN